MRMQFFGNSYDVVKRFLLRSLEPSADWAAFPMFTDRATTADVTAFESFLNVKVVEPAPFTESTNRANHFAALAQHRNIFLDPDTGIKLKAVEGPESMKYVFAPDSPRDQWLILSSSSRRGRWPPTVKKAYQAFDEEFAFLDQVLQARAVAGLTQARDEPRWY